MHGILNSCQIIQLLVGVGSDKKSPHYFPVSSTMALKIQIECHVGGATFSTKCKEEQYEAAFSEVESELKSMWPDVDVSCPRE